MILRISSTQNSKDEVLSLVSKFIFTGTVKYGDALFSKEIIKSIHLIKNQLQLFISIGGINGILLPFINVFKTV